MSEQNKRVRTPQKATRPTAWIWLSALMLGISILAFSTLFVLNLREETLLTKERNLARHTLTLAEQADRSFQSVDLVVSSVEEYVLGQLQHVSLDALSDFATNNLLRQKIPGLPHLDALVIVNAEGAVVNYSRAMPIRPVDVSDRDYFTTLKTHPSLRTFVSAPVRNRGNGEWTFYLARRLTGANGEFLGLILGGMTLTSFEGFYKSTVFDVDGSVSLTRNDGMILARHPHSSVGRVIDTGIRILKQNQSGLIREPSELAGDMRIKAAHRLPNFPVYVLTTMTEEAALSSWRKIAQWCLGLAVGLSLLLFVAAGLLVRWWTQQRDAVRSTEEKAQAEGARAEAEANLLRERERTADEASRVKSAFLASMSHEIRTPMNGILGMAELLGTTGLSDHQRRLVTTIDQSAHTLLAIINDILDISRIEAGKLELDAQDFDLRSCVESAVELLSEPAARKGLEISLLMMPSMPTRLNGDAGRLRQVLVNIIGNAVKFTRAGGVTIRVSEAAPLAGGNKIRIAIADTGIGIDDAAKATLFKPFVQADSSISRRFGGTGLGLSIAKNIVALMQGDMWLDSVPGQGTTVTFEVVLGAVAEQLPLAPACPASVRGMHVLVLDAREINREIASCYLGDCGAVVESAASSEEALSLLEKRAGEGKTFDVIVLDVNLPGAHGRDLAAHISASSAFGRPRMIVAASLSLDSGSPLARPAGAAAVINKPIRRSDLLAAVGATMSDAESRTLQPAQAMAPVPVLKKPLDGRRVLVAEDNPVNQIVIREYAAALGCTVLVVDNGLTAVAAFSRSAFDLVLMDCQMPEMDGYTACREIREIERGRGSGRTPIIAVTANAYESDRQLCLAADMDDFLAKPTTLPQLLRMAEKWLPQPMRTQAPAAPVSERSDTPAQPASEPDAVFDKEKLASLEEQQAGLGRKLAELYLVTAPHGMEQIMRGIADHEFDDIRRAAHSLKSASATVGAMRTAGIATRLEDEARRAVSMEACLLLAATLETAFTEAKGEIVEFSQSGLRRAG